MKIQHQFNGEGIEGVSRDELPQFIMTNKHGGFFLGSSGVPTSKFNGLFFPVLAGQEWDMYKTVESIGIPKVATSIINSVSQIQLQKDASEETFFLNHTHSMLYEVKNYSGDVKLTLDCKKLYDSSEYGRIYTITKEDGCILVRYVKYTDASLSAENYSLYLAIKTNMKSSSLNSWVPRSYIADQRRNSAFQSYVFEALSFQSVQKTIGTVAIAFSTDKKEALSHAKNIFKNKTTLKQLKTRYISSMLLTKFPKRRDMLAYVNVVSHFDDLIMEMQTTGIFAGLPWFFQFWARDEAIASSGLLAQERYDDMKHILLRWLLSSVQGRIPNRHPASSLGSADATGWVLFRLHQLLRTLSDKQILAQHFSIQELEEICTFAEARVLAIEQTYAKSGIIYNDSLETWMDTGVHKGDIRSGFRIEIQALQIASYACIDYLQELLHRPSEAYTQKKTALINCVKKEFYNGIYLFDGLNDPTIRPNVFIAAYVAPELLSKGEWDICFRKVLGSLFVKNDAGGGIATIDRTSPLFCSKYTGENNDSYHRGDVWYWLNCLVAIVLRRQDAAKYKEIILALKNAYVEELLWSGAVGCSAELSSCVALESQGCLSQAWSYGLFLELLHEEQSF